MQRFIRALGTIKTRADVAVDPDLGDGGLGTIMRVGVANAVGMGLLASKRDDQSSWRVLMLGHGAWRCARNGEKLPRIGQFNPLGQDCIRSGKGAVKVPYWASAALIR